MINTLFLTPELSNLLWLLSLSTRKHTSMACQISLKNSQNSKLPTILFGIFACTFSETAFLEIAVCLTRTVLDCEQSLFSQSSLSSAGLERAKWPRGKLERGFAGGLQLSIKFLTQTTYAIYRVVIQSFLTTCVQFPWYVAKLSMNSTANGSSGSWSSLNFFALKIGGTVTYCLIIIVSLVANSLIVIIVCKTPNLKKPINYFIANMASSDLLFPVFSIPFKLSLLHANSFLIGGQLGQALCKLLPFFGSVSFVVSIQNLILIAVDRFGAVVFPLRSPLIRSKLCPFFILATWMFAIVFISQDFLAFELVEYPEGARCVRRWKKVFGESSSFASLLLAYNILFTYIPVLLLVILYSIIFIEFKTQAHPGEQWTNNQQQRKRKNGNVLQMSIAIVTVFVLCWLPFSTNHLMIAYQDSSAHFSCSFQIYFDVTYFMIHSVHYRFTGRKFSHCYDRL